MKVVVSRRVPESGLKLLKQKKYDIIYHDSMFPLDYKSLMKNSKKADGLWCLLDDIIDKNFIDQCPKLKIIANYAVGYNNIPVEYAKNRDIWVTHTPDVLTNSTADLAFALLLSVARKIVEGHNYTINGKFKGWGSTLLLGSEISGKTLGILGAGRIGSAMARRGKGFDMDVIYFSRSSNQGLDAFGCRKVDLETLLESSDFISLHLPLTTETHHILDKNKLSLIKKGAYLINTGRGKLIDEPEMVKLLEKNHLGGVGLDVYEDEPNIHPKLFDLDNVVLLTHIGSATQYSRETMSEMCANAIIDTFEGQRPKHLVPLFNNEE